MKSLTNQIEKENMTNIIRLASEILNGDFKNEVNLANKCREINNLRSQSNLEWKNDPFITFFRLDDDVDYEGIPLKEDVRKRWNQEALKKLNLKLKKIIEFYKEDILKSCKTILDKYSKIK